MIPSEVYHPAQFSIAEGPVWHEGCLFWVDIPSGVLHRVAAGIADSRDCGDLLGAAVPASDGRWLLARRDGFFFLDWESGALEFISNPRAENPETRFNDGKCDPRGRFWAGTMALDGSPGKGSLYCLERALPAREVFDGVSISNGLAWSGDQTRFYYIDSLTRRIDLFDYDAESGSISNRRIFRTIPKEYGIPDGMCIDENGNLWVAFWGGSAVRCFDGTTGEELAQISVPATQVSSCCFGDGNELFITTARCELSETALEKQPLAGSIFRAEPGVSGPPPRIFQV